MGAGAETLGAAGVALGVGAAGSSYSGGGMAGRCCDAPHPNAPNVGTDAIGAATTKESSVAHLMRMWDIACIF